MVSEKKTCTATAILELKLASSLSREHGEPLFTVYLDLKKAYDSVDREQLLYILDFYGFGNRIKSIISEYWRKKKAVIKKGFILW